MPPGGPPLPGRPAAVWVPLAVAEEESPLAIAFAPNASATMAAAAARTLAILLGVCEEVMATSQRRCLRPLRARAGSCLGGLEAELVERGLQRLRVARAREARAAHGVDVGALLGERLLLEDR